MAIIKLLASKSPVSNAVNYVTQKEKTEDKLISGVNCMPESIVDEFEMTKQKFNKLGGRTYYHMIQSFASDDDITPEQAHEIGLQMAEHCFPGYQVLVATHIDRQHMQEDICQGYFLQKNKAKNRIITATFSHFDVYFFILIYYNFIRTLGCPARSCHETTVGG